MLPIFNNYTWIIIFLLVMFYVIRDWRKAKEVNGYMKILYVSSFISGVCVIDALAGGSFLNKIIPNYMFTLVPVTIVVAITTLFIMNFHDIKHSEQSDEERRKSIKERIIKPAVQIILGFIGLYNIKYIAPVVGKILIFIGLGK